MLSLNKVKILIIKKQNWNILKERKKETGFIKMHQAKLTFVQMIMHVSPNSIYLKDAKLAL